MDYIDENGRPASTGPSMSEYGMAKMEQENKKHFYGKIILQKQGKYQGAFQYGIFIEDIEIGRMCREYTKGSGWTCPGGFEWNMDFWDEPEYIDPAYTHCPRYFKSAKAAKQWLKDNHDKVVALKKFSEPDKQ
jgi:hypothetical protein